MIAAAHPVPGADPGSWAAAVATCPKHMAFGPCAGVGADGDCEVPGAGSCSYLAVPDADVPYLDAASAAPRPAEHEFVALARTRPVVITDLPVAESTSHALLATADRLRGATDALLLGDHGGARLQLPPSYRARLLTEAGLPVWAGINCRDRNRVAVEAELMACADLGVRGVHCVTGDHTALGDRPDAQPVFDLDSLGATRLAARHGLLTSVAHAPGAPPWHWRVPRLLAKVDAGATVVFLDHCGGPDEVAAAATALRVAGFAGLLLACVPIVLDADTAAVVESFGADRLPPGYVRTVLDAPDPGRAGVEAALALATALLAVPGIDGVNLSGGAGAGGGVRAADLIAEIGTTLMEHHHLAEVDR